MYFLDIQVSVFVRVRPFLLESAFPVPNRMKMIKIPTKCIGNNSHLLEQKASIFADFVRFMIESAFPKRNSQKHRLNLLVMLRTFEIQDRNIEKSRYAFPVGIAQKCWKP